MSVWYTEKHTPHAGITMEVDRSLFKDRSRCQEVEVVETFQFGRVLLLDGLVMLTERDEFIYHEMLAHVPLVSHGGARDVLVIGGGDGGTVREVLKHGSVESVTLVEIDPMVVETARRFFPDVSCGLSDERVTVLYQDGVEFAAEAEGGRFDAILVDSTDPVGPAEALFAEPFLASCGRILAEDGVLSMQSESPVYHLPFMAELYSRTRRLFGWSRFYLAPVTTYPGGSWSFLMARQGEGPAGPGTAAPAEPGSRGLKTRYYNAAIHQACFALPSFLAEALEDR